MSDHHKLTYTVLKTEFVKSESTSISYRCYKTFSTDQFNEDLQFNIAKIPKENVSYDVFNQTLISILDKHAPPKKKLVRANNAPFMNKDVRKLIMLRSKAKREPNKNKTVSNMERYKKVRNRCVKLIRRTKRRYFENLDVKFVNDNKKFWKTIQPLLNDKNAKANKIVLIENDEILSDSNVVAQTLNNHFVNITESLNIARPLSDNVQHRRLTKVQPRHY